MQCGRVVQLDGVLCTRREVCSGGLLPVGGSVPAHVPARESATPACSAGETLCTRQQQKWQRRGKKQNKVSLKKTGSL